MHCDQVPLIELLGDELESAQWDQALAHIEVCPTCRERLQTMAAVKALDGRTLSLKPSRLRFGALAASLLIALLIPAFYLIRHTSVSEAEELAGLATTEKHPYFPLRTRSDASRSSQESRRRAFAAYSINRFKEASTWFQRLPANAAVLFYGGVTHYLLGEYPTALEKLGQAVELDRQWEGAAGWYEANTYLQTGQKERAETKLKELVNQSSEYEKRALQLLQELERWE